MRTVITRRYHFEAAHWLPHVPDTHKCHRIHGHNYVVEISIDGEPDNRGFVIDFFELDAIVDPLIAMIDHRTLNDIAGLTNPTAELIAAWFLERVEAGFQIPPIAPDLFVARVRCYETRECWADVGQ